MPEQNLQPTIWELMGMMQGAGIGGGAGGVGGGVGGGNLDQYLMGLLGKAGEYEDVLSKTGGFDPGALQIEMTPMEWREQVYNPAEWTAGRITKQASTTPEGFYAGETQYKDVEDIDILSGLMGQEGFGTWDEDVLREEISKLFSGEVTGYEEDTLLTPQQELLNSIAPEFWQTEGTQEAFQNVGLTESSMDEVVSMMQALQEGRRSLAAKEKKFRLGEKLGRTELGEERAVESAYQGYVPRETLSRYRGVQHGGSSIADQMAEADYLAKLSGTQRKTGRGVRDIYGGYKDELFGGIERWLGNLT